MLWRQNWRFMGKVLCENASYGIKNVWEMFLEVLQYVGMPVRPLPDVVVAQNPPDAWKIKNINFFNFRIFCNFRNLDKTYAGLCEVYDGFTINHCEVYKW